MSLSRLLANPKLRIAAVTLFDQVVYSGTTFLTGILVGRLLSVGDFGEFSLGLTLMVFSRANHVVHSTERAALKISSSFS